MPRSGFARPGRTIATLFRPTSPGSGGRVEVDPAFAAGFATLGIESPAGFLDLPGEVVSGHPDRHVVRVYLPGFPKAFYLKRQHVVTRRERWRNWAAGFGWASRCDREAAILKQLAAAGLPCPRVVAVGADGQGRSFLLVEELEGARDLSQTLKDPRTSREDRHRLADRLGGRIAMLHATGFTTPDLTAKHVLVSPALDEVIPIDWQSARRVKVVSVAGRLRSLAALHASVAERLATPRERLRVLWAALRPARKSGLITGRFSNLVRTVVKEAARLTDRRSIRDQRQAPTASQRLVWVAGEAVCAIPEVAATWPSPATGTPYYGGEAGTFPTRLPDGGEATLIRGLSFAPIGRLGAWLRGRSWRSPGVTLGRVLFHLDRYGIPAPRLLAFGQRFTGPASAEWFALHTPAAEPLPGNLEPATAELLGRRLRRLHDAGCVLTGDPLAVFGVTSAGVCIRDPMAIRITRQVDDRDRKSDLARLLAVLTPRSREAAETGYHFGPPWVDRVPTDRGVGVAIRQTSIPVNP